MSDATKPFFPAWERFQSNGDEIALAIGSKAGSYLVNGTQVVGARSTGFTAFTGGSSHKGGINGTQLMGTADTTSVTTLSTAVLTVGTMVTNLNKWAFAVDALLRAHGLTD